MKRKGHLFPKLLSNDNLARAIREVCKSHRWVRYPDKPNKVVLWLESDMDSRVKELREIIENGFEPSPVIRKQRYDANAGKWRDIAEPRIWPDQCVHHALIQIIEPVMMRGMDHWCCGSIKNRGTHYGIRRIKRWMSYGKGVKYCVEMDIRHFYDSLRPELVLNRMKCLIKDFRLLDLIWRVIRGGIQIGSYCSQWFANTFLQPLDQLIRANGIRKYIRYMDNFTILTNRKRTGHKIVTFAKKWLKDHSLSLKGNWQIFPTRARLPNALGYRFGDKYVLLRKKNLLRLKRQIRTFYRLRERGKFITVRLAQGLLSRLGMFRHCNSVYLYRTFVPRKTQRKLKEIVREYQKRMEAKALQLAIQGG